MSWEIIDSRDLLEELKTLDKEYDEDRIKEINNLIEEVGEEDFKFGVTFIHENYWREYCEDFAYDCGYLDRQDDSNPLHFHINWRDWADSMAMDYGMIDFDNSEYYWRA